MEPSIVLTVDSQSAKIQDSVYFYYGLFWSGDETFGGEIAPREGDSVYVPKG